MNQETNPIDVVMRSYNDRPLIEETLSQLLIQDMPYRLFVLDNESTDGTRELVDHYAHRVIDIPSGTYVPGRVLNEGMRATSSPVVVFLNSDCTPVDGSWLSKLVDGFELEVECAARFGRQMPRPDCWPLFAKDTEDAFGDGVKHASWRHFFSMASAAVRRDVWQQMPFNENLIYSEDIEWTWRARQRGYAIRYMPESRVWHSHNYTLGQSYRRYRGEGLAESEIFPWTEWEESFVRYTLLPLIRRVGSDWKFCLRHFHLLSMFHSPLLRTMQAWGRHRGFQEGLRRLESMRPAWKFPEVQESEVQQEEEKVTSGNGAKQV